MSKLLKAIALCGFLALATPAFSQAIQVQVGPPAARVERIPPSPNNGARWTPGYWQWNGVTQSYQWQPGSWQTPPRRSMSWVPSHYVQQDDGTYRYYAGHWATKHQAHEEREAELKHER